MANSLDQDSICEKIKQGFKINSMNMKDASNGHIWWQVTEWNLGEDSQTEHLPKELLNCSEIVREINFSSVQPIENLELVQNFYLHGELIESSRFFFGFVIPNSTNNWEQYIEAKDEVIPRQVLSGNLIVETLFLTNGNIISKNSVTIYYI